jgi:hypothetical protein
MRYFIGERRDVCDPSAKKGRIAKSQAFIISN